MPVCRQSLAIKVTAIKPIIAVNNLRKSQKFSLKNYGYYMKNRSFLNIGYDQRRCTRGNTVEKNLVSALISIFYFKAVDF